MTGTNSVGISTLADTTINNHGLISATGEATHAIRGGAEADTLNLFPGSQIIGAIDLGSGTNAVNIFGASPSATLHIQNAGPINLRRDAVGVQVGETVTVIDPSGQSVTGAALAALTTELHSVVAQHLSHGTRPLGYNTRPVQVAARELTAGMLSQEDAPLVWGKLFGSRRWRDTESQVQAYEHDYYGFVGGYERDYRRARLGLLLWGRPFSD